MISILGDEEKRALYDHTGCVDDAVSDYLDVLFLFLFESIASRALG